MLIKCKILIQDNEKVEQSKEIKRIIGSKESDEDDTISLEDCKEVDAIINIPTIDCIIDMYKFENHIFCLTITDNTYLIKSNSYSISTFLNQLIQIAPECFERSVIDMK